VPCARRTLQRCATANPTGCNQHIKLTRIFVTWEYPPFHQIGEHRPRNSMAESTTNR
jgi:hypothetical protein